jgi:thioredoxin reductase (NADPH)
MNKNKRSQEDRKVYDLVVIGGGPAGISAAIYAKRSLLKILVLEKGLIGGKINKTDKIENYLGFNSIKGAKLSEKLQKQASIYRIDWELDEVVELSKKGEFFEIITKNNKKINSLSAILSSGTNEKKVGFKGERKFANKGVSYCVICDGFLFKGKKVAIIGGGYSAFEAALYMSKIASKVYLIHHNDKFRADREIVEKVKKNKKIELLLFHKLDSAEGKDRIESVTVENVLEKNETKRLDLSVVFPCIGLIPCTEFVSKFENLLDDENYVRIRDDCTTSITGLFAAGDAARISKNKIKQIITAASEGATAAQSAIKYLKLVDN